MYVTTEMGRKRLTPERLANRVIWVTKLLSDEYRQGYGSLRNSSFDTDRVVDRWCCLGVAGHCLAPGAEWIDADAEQGFLPTKWAFDKLGITSDERDGDQAISARWNDGRDLSFASIADRIALATEMKQNFFNIGYDGNKPAELRNLAPGDYARAWLQRMAVR